MIKFKNINKLYWFNHNEVKNEDRRNKKRAN